MQTLRQCLTLFAVAFVGCGGSSDPTDASPHDVGAQDAADAEQEAAPEGGGACEKTVTAYCANSPCISSWPADLTLFCPIVINYGMQTETCADYHAAYDQGVDRRTAYYYDLATGKLTAIFQLGFDGLDHCVAGPADFVDPGCGWGQLVDCSDGGGPADGGP